MRKIHEKDKIKLKYMTIRTELNKDITFLKCLELILGCSLRKLDFVKWNLNDGFDKNPSQTNINGNDFFSMILVRFSLTRAIRIRSRY